MAAVAWKAAKQLLDSAKARSSVDMNALDVQIKANAADLVTRADTEAEQTIREELLSKYPEFQLIGEESYSAGSDKRFLLDKRPTFIVDPIDGTVNWVHLFPAFCISIAFCLDEKPVVGVILAPALAGLTPNAGMTLFSGCSGQGAYISFLPPLQAAPTFTWPPTSDSTQLPYVRPAAPLPLDAPKGCIFCAEWGKDRRGDEDSNLSKKVRSFKRLATGMVHGMRSLGSAALDVAYVATGALDIFWECGAWEWDVAAGVVILEEAGGLVVSANPPAEEDQEDDRARADAERQLPPVNLGSRLYLCIRGCGATEDETARQQQQRVARAIWAKTERIEYPSRQ